ncbi:hypothetical protein DFJ73DRAFT_819597 [Zopfochytrium polystomum]|nr:hypothetical protein DFJ73DRAFT_819597 [Zopfochytrium polystomum]
MDAYAAAAAAATGIPLTKMELSCIVVGKPAPSPPFAISVLPTTSIYQMREYVALRLESSLLARRLTHLDLDLYRADTGPIFSDDPKLEMLSVSAHAFAPSDIRSTIPATLMTTDVRATVAHFFTAGQTFSSFAKANGLTEGRRLFAAVDVIVAVRKDAFLDSRSIDEGYEDSSSSHSEGSVKFAPAGTIHVAGDDFTVPSPAQKRRSQVTFQQDHEITFQGISRPKSSTTFSASFRNSLRDLQLAALANANSAMAGTPTSTEFQLMVQQQILQQQLQQSQQFEFNASNTSSPDNLTLRTYGGASSTKTGDEAAITAVAAAEAYFRKTSHDLNSMSFAQASMAIERPTPVAQPGRKSEEGFLPSLHNAAGPQALSAVGRSRTASVASVRTLGDSRPKSLSSLRMRRLARRFLRGPWLAAIIVGGVFLVAAIALLVVLWPRPVNVETISMVQQPGVPTNGTGAANGSFSVISMLVVGLRSNGVIPLSLRNATASGSLVDGGSGGAALLFSAILDGNSSATLPPGTTTPIQLPSTMTLSGTGNQVAAPQSFADAISIVCRQLQNPASLEMTYNLSLDFPLYSWAGFKPQLQGKFALSCPAH